MILGIGIDLCRISRMERAIRSRHFLERVFRPEEIAYAEGRGRGRAASLAAAFAAREAFCKASRVPLAVVTLGGGFTLLHEGGAPRVRLSSDVERSPPKSRRKRTLHLPDAPSGPAPTARRRERSSCQNAAPSPRFYQCP